MPKYAFILFGTSSIQIKRRVKPQLSKMHSKDYEVTSLKVTLNRKRTKVGNLKPYNVKVTFEKKKGKK